MASAKLYPELSKPSEEAQACRLQEIARLKEFLENEISERAKLYKKYRRGVNVLEGTDGVLLTASISLGFGGVGLLSTIIAAPVVVGLEIGALVCGLLGVSGKIIGRRLAVKAKKHDNIRTLAESKLNTIADHVSTALMDGHVSEEEFRLIVTEIEKYKVHKNTIRVGAGKVHAGVARDQEAKNTLAQKRRKEALAQLIKEFGSA